jgi:hypothetical protein
MGTARRRLIKLWLVIMALGLAFGLFIRLIAWGGCSWYGYQLDRETRFAPFIGCTVKIDGRWIPRDELRTVQ